MLYRIAHILRDKFSWAWNIIEWVNAVLFSWRYGKRLKGFAFTAVPEGYEAIPLRTIATEKLVAFFGRQPKEAFTYFRPHGFDERSIQRLQRNKAFLGYALLDKENGEIAG